MPSCGRDRHAGNTAPSIAAKAATTTIPIVFGASQDPVKDGLVASLARPGGNATGTNGFSVELVAKRLALLHELLPEAVRIAVLSNPAHVGNEPILPEVKKAARPIGLQIHVLNASTSCKIDAAFAVLARERPDALIVSPDSFFSFSARVQITTLAARGRIAAVYSNRDYVVAGGLMSYGTDTADRFRQAGVYTGKILNGANPADLPVLQPPMQPCSAFSQTRPFRLPHP